MPNKYEDYLNRADGDPSIKAIALLITERFKELEMISRAMRNLINDSNADVENISSRNDGMIVADFNSLRAEINILQILFNLLSYRNESKEIDEIAPCFFPIDLIPNCVTCGARSTEPCKDDAGNVMPESIHKKRFCTSAKN